MQLRSEVSSLPGTQESLGVGLLSRDQFHLVIAGKDHSSQFPIVETGNSD